jgi:hypothetical protein
MVFFDCLSKPKPWLFGPLAVTFPLALLSLGCGKEATPEDCERIVVRMAELELRANRVTDPVLVAQQVAATKDSFKKRALEECVGRQISAKAMDCIASAKTSDEILGECLN